MWDAVLSEMANEPKDVQEVAGEQRSYGNMPLIVLSAGAAESDGAAQIGAGKVRSPPRIVFGRRLRDEDAALSNRGVNCLIPGASHYLQIEKPEIVVQAAPQVVRDSQTRDTRPSCNRL